MKKGRTEREKEHTETDFIQRSCTGDGNHPSLGNLTGIRPTKIAMGLIESGMSNAETADYAPHVFHQ